MYFYYCFNRKLPLLFTAQAVDHDPRPHQEAVHQTAVVRAPHGRAAPALAVPPVARAAVEVVPETGKSRRGKLY